MTCVVIILVDSFLKWRRVLSQEPTGKVPVTQ